MRTLRSQTAGLNTKSFNKTKTEKADKGLPTSYIHRKISFKKRHQIKCNAA